MVSEDLMKSFNIAVVVRGSLNETSGFADPDPHRYEVPRTKGCFKCAPVTSPPPPSPSRQVKKNATGTCFAGASTKLQQFP